MNTYTKTDNNKNQLILGIINNHADYKDKLDSKPYGETDEEQEARLELTKIYIKEVRNFSKVEELVLDKRDFNETLVKGQKLEGGGMSGFTNLKKLVIGGNIETVSGLENLKNLEELIITSEKFQGNITQFALLTTLKKLDIKKERDGVYRTYVKGFTGNLETLEGGLGQLPDSLIKLHYKNTVYAPVLDTFGGNYQLWRTLKDNAKQINRKELVNSASPKSSAFFGIPYDPKETPQFILEVINREGKPYDLQLENDKTQLTTQKLELENQNNIDKSNELAKEVENKDNVISNRDKTINTLQLKNEKLSVSYKKLIQHLADARLLVSHLQKDLEDKKEKTYELREKILLLKFEDQEYIDELKKRIDDTHLNTVETHLLSLTVWKD
ncbi:13241_t:CDS:2 [Funneliformis geosporum]|nr:13241_t:CDS:2 [Funneliformis geosporum]